MGGGSRQTGPEWFARKRTGRLRNFLLLSVVPSLSARGTEFPSRGKGEHGGNKRPEPNSPHSGRIFAGDYRGPGVGCWVRRPSCPEAHHPDVAFVDCGHTQLQAL